MSERRTARPFWLSPLPPKGIAYQIQIRHDVGMTNNETNKGNPDTGYESPTIRRAGSLSDLTANGQKPFSDGTGTPSGFGPDSDVIDG